MENSGGCVGWMLMLDVEHRWTFPGDADQWGNERSSPWSGHPLSASTACGPRQRALCSGCTPPHNGGAKQGPGIPWKMIPSLLPDGLRPPPPPEVRLLGNLHTWGAQGDCLGEEEQSLEVWLGRPSPVSTSPCSGERAKSCWLARGGLLLHLQHYHTPLLVSPEFSICIWLSGHHESIFVHQRLKHIYQLIRMI